MNNNKKFKTINVELPSEDDFKIPESLDETVKLKNNYLLKGRGSKNADIVFISSSAYTEEVDDSTSPATFLKGPIGSLFSRACLKMGIDLREQYYTSLVPFALPKKYKFTPTKAMISKYSRLLEKQLEEINPRIIVCLGKPVFDYLFPYKFKLNEILGGWFQSDRYDCLLYAMDNPYKVLKKPEAYERLCIDLKEVKYTLDEIYNNNKEKIHCEYEYIDTESQLQELVDRLIKFDYKLFSIDAEWAGQDFVDGLLRYFQFCWEPGKGARVKLMDETQQYCFDASLERVREIISPLFNRDDVRFIGHQISADAVWYHNHLGVDIFGKVVFDTLYARNLLDTASEVKLEKLAMEFTDLGRYDIDLLIFKKKNKIAKNEGYARIPDDILGPYSIKDVDVPMRVYPILLQKLIKLGVYDYWKNIRLPFVTDGFYKMAETGLPCDREVLDEMRDQYVFVRNLMEEIFLSTLEQESNNIFLSELVCCTHDYEFSVNLLDEAKQLRENYNENQYDEFIDKLKSCCSTNKKFIKPLISSFKHLLHVREFKHGSSEQLKVWLYDVKKYTPIMSTKTADGPSIAWEKIQKLDADEQINYNPSTDKDTLQIYAEKGDKTINILMWLKSVTSVTRMFLRDDNQGIHKYLTSDGRVHTNFSVTESGRPRSWCPNILNSPSYVQKNILSAFDRSIEFLNSLEDIETFKNYYENKYGGKFLGVDNLQNVYPIRYNYHAEDGYCFTDSDYCTAEVVALGYVSGDETIIKVTSEPDKQFGLKLDENNSSYPVRLKYIEENSNISKEKQDSSILVSEDDPELVRDETGLLVHPKRDVHWEFVENKTFKDTSREFLDKKIDRGAGKTGNFSVPYGGQEELLERKLEIDTGIKPPPGTGKKIKNTYEQRYKTATKYLEEREEDPELYGEFRSVTGYYRKYHVYREGDVEGLSEYARNSILNPLKREARNTPIQSIVSDMLARAVVWLNKFYIKNGLKTRAVVPLYDAMLSYGPIEERWVAAQAHQYYMAEINTWEIHGRTLKMEIETDFCLHWATDLPLEDSKKFNDENWKTTNYTNLNWEK